MSGSTDRTIKAILTLRDDLPDPTPLKVIGMLLNGAGREIQQSASQCCIFFVLGFFVFFFIATSIFLTRLFCLSPGVMLPVELRRLLILDLIASFSQSLLALEVPFLQQSSRYAAPSSPRQFRSVPLASECPHRGVELMKGCSGSLLSELGVADNSK